MSLNDIIAFAHEQQRRFNEDISHALRSMEGGDSLLPTLTLVTAGFLYGLFHAIGPGHGKLVISGYVLAGKSTLRDAWLLSALAAFMQALTAMILVLGAFYVLDLSKSHVEALAGILEITSGAMIAAIGLWLCVRGARGLSHAFRPAHRHADHDHHHCQHQHTLTPNDVSANTSFREKLLMIFSIGIRPCSGALILLFFSCIVGLAWSGVLATLAMAAGTAIATSAIAFLAVTSKRGLLAFAGTSEKTLAIAQSCVSLAAGAMVIAAGTLMIAILSARPVDVIGMGSPSQRPHPLMPAP